MERTIYSEKINNQIKWLSSLIMPNGELIMHNEPNDDKYRIVPYFSNIACTALLLDSSNTSLVKKYLNWYVSHLNFPDRFGINGTIYDYILKTDGQNISTNDYDSYDSYPATFISLCRKYYEVSKDYDFFFENKDNFNIIVNQMLLTMDSDYLTWAKPNYLVKYLMDNCEVYRGIQDAIIIYNYIYKDHVFSKKLSSLSENIFSSIEENMWNPKGFYHSQIDEKGRKTTPKFNKWYPDATSQLFPILHGLINPQSQRAQQIYTNFNNNFPKWSEHQYNDFPDVYVGFIALIMRDHDNVTRFLNYCTKNYVDKDNIWPWYCVECSYYIKIAIKYSKYTQ